MLNTTTPPTSIHQDPSQPTPRQNRGLPICIFITQLLIPIFFTISIIYMHLSVHAAYETEFVEDEPSSEMQPLLDHFPGFRLSFSGLILFLILTQILLAKGNGTKFERITTLFLLIITTTLFFYIQFYQHKHDRFLRDGSPVRIFLLCSGYISVIFVILYYFVKLSRHLK